MNKIKNVLFFCAGNTCRSPFAEYYAKWLKDTKYRDELKDVNFDSAGLFHYYETPREGTINYLNMKGIDINDFHAKKIDNELLLKQDLILGFEQKHHINKVKRKFKHIKDLDKKTHLLLKFIGEKADLDIPDPFYFETSLYNEILRKIEKAVEKVLEEIIKINKSNEK